MDILGQTRSQYPEQKVLVPRPETKHDFLMQQMRKEQFKMQEELKYRKAICFHLAKSAMDQFSKKKLKKEEKYLFHRVAYSQLAEAVRQRISERKDTKQQEKPNQVKQEKAVKQRGNDDIFLQKEESEPNMNGLEGDLLDDLLDNPKFDIQPEKIELPPQPTIDEYLIKLNEVDKSKECTKILNCKSCLKRMSENIRARNKSKLNENQGEKNLNSATILLNSLIKEGDQKQTGDIIEHFYIETPAENKFLINSQSKSNRKKDENFKLKWNKQFIEEFEQKNGKFQINKSKFESSYLTPTIMRDQKQYSEIFQKNIKGKQPFPPSINSIPDLNNRFKVNPYYNTEADREYEDFIIKYNKKEMFEKFKQVSTFILSENYNNDSDMFNVAKIFLNPEGNFSERVVYKVNNNKLIPVNAVQQKTNLSRQQLLLLSFLVRKYLSVFGNNWSVITDLILTHPNFSCMHLNTEIIQQLYQIVRFDNNQNPIQQINMMSKKALPSSVFVNSSYEQMKPEQKMQVIQQEMTDQSQIFVQGQKQINFDDYENIINQKLISHQEEQRYTFENTAKMYEQYAESAHLPHIVDYSSNLDETVSDVIHKFEGKNQIKYVDAKTPQKFSLGSEWVLQKVKNQIKFNTPIRKRKNITDKSSELVKILHLLKQKLQNPRPPPTQPPRPQSLPTSQEPTRQTAPPSQPAPPVNTPAPPVKEQVKKILKPKPEQKKQKPVPTPKQTKQQKQRKKKGKDGDKEPQSK